MTLLKTVNTQKKYAIIKDASHKIEEIIITFVDNVIAEKMNLGGGCILEIFKNCRRLHS